MKRQDTGPTHYRIEGKNRTEVKSPCGEYVCTPMLPNFEVDPRLRASTNKPELVTCPECRKLLKQKA